MCVPLLQVVNIYDSKNVFMSLQTTESIDVFCFGHLLFEMTYGQPPDSVPVDQFPSVSYTAVGVYTHNTQNL